MDLTTHLPPEDLVAWDDGTAKGARAGRIGVHLAGCAACRQRLEEFRGVGRLLRDRFPAVDDPAARAAILARTSGATPSRAQSSTSPNRPVPPRVNQGAAVRPRHPLVAVLLGTLRRLRDGRPA